MTSNQINYWRLKEEQRANRAKEAETHRANTAQEQETNRSNVAKESLNALQHNEVKRHNMMTEGLDISKLNETSRHNQQSEIIERNKADNAAIRDKLTIEETARHNKATESTASFEALSKANREDAKVAVERDKLAETQRLNTASMDKMKSDAIKSEAGAARDTWSTLKDILDFIL